jgi:hypothetical protein
VPTSEQYAAMHLPTSNLGKSFPKKLGVACTFEVTTVTLACCFLKPRRPVRLEGGPNRLFTASRALRNAVNSRGGRDAEKNSRGYDASRETIEALGNLHGEARVGMPLLYAGRSWEARGFTRGHVHAGPRRGARVLFLAGILRVRN